MNIDYRFSVAPMMGYTTPYARYFYRLLSKKAVLFTEMVASQALIRGNQSILCQKNDLENPVILQVGGNDEKDMAKCSNIAEKYNYDGINLNIGCPSKKVLKGRFGACLMQEPLKVSQMVKSIKRESSLEISIKCRTGVDDKDNYDFLKNFIALTSEAGCKVFFVHARKAHLKGLSPKQNRTIPKLEYEKVYKLKNDFPHLKIILNGGINNLNNFNEHYSSLDGIMMGRAIQKNPFILLDVDKKIFKINEIDKKNKIKIIKNYFKFIQNYIGKISSYHLISPLLAMYFGAPNSKSLKQKINDYIITKNFEKLEKICIDSFS